MANGTWKIARSRGTGQLPLAIVAVLVIVVLLVGKAQPTVFDKTRAHIGDFMEPVLTSMRTPLAAIDRFFGSIGDIFVVYRENLRLKEENARLKQWRNVAIVLQDRVGRYQLLLKAVPDPALSSVTARVIGRANRPFIDTMILDAGKAHGIKPGQAVVDARGMLGRIFIAGNQTSWVILLTDLNSRVPVMIEPGDVQAIMGGDNTTSPTIEVVSENAQIKDGAQVVSSGDGSILPPGLPIGTIAGQDGSFRVALLADAASASDVDVLDFKRPLESPPAPSASDLPATAAGLPPAAPPPQVPSQMQAPAAPAPNPSSASPATKPAASARKPTTLAQKPTTFAQSHAAPRPVADGAETPTPAQPNAPPANTTDDGDNQ